MERHCKACKKPFTYTNPKQLYCSRTCLKHTARQKQLANKIRVCAYCNQEYSPSVEGKRQRFCSKRCGLLNRYSSPEYTASIPDRFWSYVDKSSDCWEWQATIHTGGYGEFSVNGHYILAHRYSWELHNGMPAGNLLVCHSCDNPRCVRPDHLFLGTDADNVQDMIKKRRHQHGEAHRSSKFTPAEVRAIRASTETIRTLARHYGVAHSTIGNIKRGKTWSHID